MMTEGTKISIIDKIDKNNKDSDIRINKGSKENHTDRKRELDSIVNMKNNGIKTETQKINKEKGKKIERDKDKGKERDKDRSKEKDKEKEKEKNKKKRKEKEKGSERGKEKGIKSIDKTKKNKEKDINKEKEKRKGKNKEKKIDKGKDKDKKKKLNKDSVNMINIVKGIEANGKKIDIEIDLAQKIIDIKAQEG